MAFMSAPPLYLFWDGSQLYGIDFSERRVTPLFQTGNESIINAVMLRQRNDSPAPIAIALKNGLRLIDQQGAPLGEAPYRTEADWGYLSGSLNDAGDRLYLEYQPNYFSKEDQSRKTSLEVSDLHGRILESYSHDISSGDLPPVKLWATEIVQHTLPPALALPSALSRKFLPPALPTFSTSSYPQPIFAVEMAALPALFAVSVALAVLAFALAHRAGMSTGIAMRWTIFVAAFGLPAFLAFVIAADWPRRRNCPDCRRKRPVEIEGCPHCRALWKPPERIGSEILEPI
jgi:hypothetical protein